MTYERINQLRLEKLDKLRAAGVSAYPNRFQRSHSSEQAVALLKQSEAAGQTETPPVTVAGRVMGRRSLGKISFLDLRDGAGRIQLMVGDGLDAASGALFKDLDIGDIIGVSGKLFRTRTAEATVRVAGLTMLAKSLQPLPEKWHGLSDVETRYRQRYIDLISSPEVQQTFRMRSLIISGVRQFLNNRGFIEVETPILQPEAGGALARPFTTHHHALDEEFYLRIATELHLKRLIVGGLDKVYEIGRIFRNEGIDLQHNPEFTMLESYEAYADYMDVMKMVEEMVSEVARQVLGTDEIKFGDDVIKLAPPWRRVTLRDAILEYSGIDFVKYPTAEGLREKMRLTMKDVDPHKNWAKLVDELLKTQVRPRLIQPTFLYDYPVSHVAAGQEQAG